jgi:transglutaminase-like putative cysteine protease
MNKILSLFLLFVVFLIFLARRPPLSALPPEIENVPGPIHDLLDLSGLKHEGPEWRILFQDLGQDKGHLKLSQVKWLMYFLHWRPLTETNQALSIEYVRNHMLNFWGQAMNFKLLNIDGETEVCGHKAFFTEGTVMDGAVHTRFIVWNCPQTKRQFTADCNINLRRKTPQELLDLQGAITQTVCCHGEAPPPDVPSRLEQKYRSDKWNVSFFIPSTWRTADYVSPDWFPQGMSARSGSLWTLLTDSAKRLEIVWDRLDEPLSADVFRRFLEKCTAPFKFENITTQIDKWNGGPIQEKSGVWTGEGIYELLQKAQNQEALSPYPYKGFLWKDGQKAYFLLASLVQVNEFWNIPNDLSPSDETFRLFITSQILPNIKILPLAVYSSAKTYPRPLAEDPANFLGETRHLDFSHSLFREKMDAILGPEMSWEQKLERLFYYVRDGLPFVSSASLTASGVLTTGKALCYTKAMAFVSFCRKLGVPAKLATAHWAFKADSQPRHHSHGIAKIFVKGKWIYVDTVSNRDSWNSWGLDPTLPFDPPEFSIDGDVIVGPDHYHNLTFEDYNTDDVPDPWIKSMQLYLDIGRWSRPKEKAALEPSPDLQPYLEPGVYIESRHPSIQAKVRELTAGQAGSVAKAKALFEFVRDRIGEGYIGSMKASDVLARGEGNCHEKAVLLASLARAAGVPACYQLTDVTIKNWRDGQGKIATTHFLHGVTGLYIGGRWLTYDPTGNIDRWKIWVQDEPITIQIPLEFRTDRDVLFSSTEKVMVKKIPLRLRDFDLEEKKKISRMCGIDD